MAHVHSYWKPQWQLPLIKKNNSGTFFPLLINVFVKCLIKSLILVQWAKPWSQFWFEKHKHARSSRDYSQEKKEFGQIFILSNYILLVCITFLWAAAAPVIISVQSLILCLRGCASYPSPGLRSLGCTAHRPVFSSTFQPRLLSWQTRPRGEGCGARFRRVRTIKKNEDGVQLLNRCSTLFLRCLSDLTKWSVSLLGIFFLFHFPLFPSDSTTHAIYRFEQGTLSGFVSKVWLLPKKS